MLISDNGTWGTDWKTSILIKLGFFEIVTKDEMKMILDKVSIEME